MTNNKHKTRAEILRELQSIQELLLEEGDIPLLQEVVEPAPAPEAPVDDTEPAKPAATKTSRTTLAKGAGENPFLPQHIRERLHGNNPPPSFQLQPPSTPRPAAPKTDQPIPGAQNRQALIDSVVAALQPDIERELRSRLEHLSGEALQHLLAQES